nr:alkaline phosphatase family protein [Nocardia arizonensis]
MRLGIRTSNPAVWEKAAPIIGDDENGGFFDHLTSPDTWGAFLTVPLDRGCLRPRVSGPIGLGCRMPARPARTFRAQNSGPTRIESGHVERGVSPRSPAPSARRRRRGVCARPRDCAVRG